MSFTYHFQVDATLVSNEFIDRYLAEANGEYVKVYLYLLRHQQEEVSIGQIADALNHTEADVQRALAYWQRAGVLGTEVGEEAQRSFQETPGQQISPVSASTESLAGAGSFAPSTKTAAREAAACDMSRLTSDESFKQLIYIAQQYLNKLLTPTDCQILGNLYSNLGFSGELLEYLIEYCVQNHHTSLRYMEKVALGWHKRGIKDVEQAKASGRGYTKGSFAVMRAMGLSDRSPAEVESEFIEKWFWEYGFTRELIVEACSRTIRQIHKPSFDYADKILRDWKNAGVKSFRDVSELDKKRKEEGGAKRRQASAGSSRSSNRFHNLEEHGYEVTYLPVDAYGVISLDDLKAAIRPDTILVSLMQVNNEIGAVEPIAEAGALIKQCNPQTLFHVDAIQSYGKMRIYPAKMHVDLLSVSGHKIHGPKGSGFLYIKDKTKIHPLLNGGGQQRGMRSGTENVPAIAGLGVAAERIYTGFEEKIDRMYTLREHFIEEVTKIPGVHVNGHTDRSNAPHIVSVSTEGVRAEVLLHALEDKEIYVSAGSACSSNKPSVSHTLKSIGLKPEFLDATIRFSFCVETTEEEIDYAVKEMAALVPMLQKYTRH